MLKLKQHILFEVVSKLKHYIEVLLLQLRLPVSRHALDRGGPFPRHQPYVHPPGITDSPLLPNQ